MSKELRRSRRISFERGKSVQIMGIDGTWRRQCLLLDVSDDGALLTIEGSAAGLDLKEFFMLLSSTGLAFRKCRLVRINGDQIGVEFLKPESKKKSPSRMAKRQLAVGET